jgi:hypothetical protein
MAELWGTLHLELGEKIQREYYSTIKSGNKEQALALGRLYYLHLNEGKPLSAKDEQAISNDLSLIK